MTTSATIVGTYFYDALTSNAGMPAPGVRTKGGTRGKKWSPLFWSSRYVFDATPDGTRADPERAALEGLAVSTGYAGWRRSAGWLDPAVHHCDFEGVACDKDGSVKILALSFNNMTGTFPESLELSNLQDLDIEQNAVSGRLPARVPFASTLRQLGLGGNPLGGPFPLCDALARILQRAGDTHAPCDLAGTAFDCDASPCAAALAKCGAAC